MASAVLANQNECSRIHMGKVPSSNPHLSSNPSLNSKKKQKQFHRAVQNGVVRDHNVNSPVVTQTASDDAYSFNQASTSSYAVKYGTHFTYDIGSYTKAELNEFRRRLSSELDLIRECKYRVESGHLSLNNISNSQSQGRSKMPGNHRSDARFGSIKDLKKLSDQGIGNGDLIVENAVNIDGLLKECRQILTKLMKHKMGWVFNKPVDAAALGLLDYHKIVKHPMDLGTVKANLAKNLYHSPAEFAADVRLAFSNALLYNPMADPVHVMAEQLLEQFNQYIRPIEDKMACSTGEGWVREFQDVRDGDGFHHLMGDEELQVSSWSNNFNQINSSPIRGKKSKLNAELNQASGAPVSKKPDRMQMPISMHAHSSALTPSNLQSLQLNLQPMMVEPLLSSPARETVLPVKEQKVGRGSVKLPKPKAKDSNKREMNMEEKQKLGLGLQSLPQEKMPQLVHIIRKRNEHLVQNGDEIELDIEALDTETLWELDRFVTNWKKLVSKTKRQALMINNHPAAGMAAPSTPTADNDLVVTREEDDWVKKPKENDDEDVDIDDDMPAESFPPVEIEKDEGVGACGGGSIGQDHGPGNAKGSSSGSSSDSSSSSDSDSGSSSGSGSDADDVQS